MDQRTQNQVVIKVHIDAHEEDRLLQEALHRVRSKATSCIVLPLSGVPRSHRGIVRPLPRVSKEVQTVSF